MVEILAVGVAVDHGAAEFQLAHAALELVGGAARVLHRQMREAGIAVRAASAISRARKSLASRATRVAVATSRSIWTLGPAMDSTERAMPASSMDCSRSSPKSVSRANRLAACFGSTLPTVVRQ